MAGMALEDMVFFFLLIAFLFYTLFVFCMAVFGIELFFIAGNSRACIRIGILLCPLDLSVCNMCVR